MSILTIVSELGTILQQRGEMLTTAESCTGGGIAQALTDIAGSSHWFERGFVTYSNQAKQDMLGIAADMLDQYGAVSQQVAKAMALGALKHSRAQISIATTGIAGPAGGSAEKPVGTVWFAWSLAQQPCETEQQLFVGDRQKIRQQAIEYALQRLLVRLQM